MSQLNDDLDLTNDFDLTNTINRNMMIPRYINSYTVEKIIIERKSAVIVTAIHNESQKRVALKFVPEVYFNDDLPSILRQMNHTNILPTYDIFGFPDDGSPRFHCISMPFIESDLQHYFHHTCSRSLSEMEVCQIMEEILNAIFYIHSIGICHMDLKLSNVLVEKKKTRLKPFLIDFDFSYQIENGCYAIVEPRGTLNYAAPELLQSTQLAFKPQAWINNKVDIWSLGVIMTYLLIGRNPFEFRKTNDTINSIMCGISEGDHRIVNLSPNARDLISRMLCTNPDARIDVDEALNHKWFTIDLQNYRMKHPETMDDYINDEIPTGIYDEIPAEI